MAKAEAGGLIEGRRLAKAVGLPGADKGTQKVTRALLTGYLLHVLTGDKEYRDFADPEMVLPKTVAPRSRGPAAVAGGQGRRAAQGVRPRGGDQPTGW